MTQAQESTGRLLAGRYRLNAVLGRGGMGTVWRAEDEMLGRIVAVKELRMTGVSDDEEKHRLVVRTLREAKATARIRHRAAVTVFDVVEEDERPWIVMELVESRSLAEVIKEDGTLTPARAAEIALEVLGVLVAAHSHGILHRDVKPSNVLIGEDGRVVLTDFGIASVEGDTSITSTGMLVGAPSYISPERARGQKPGPPADLWSLGGTLYSMVEGKPPYDRGSALATLTAVMTEELEPPRSAGALRPVIEGLLKKDPAMRLDAATTRAMLKRILADSAARAEATTQQAVPAPKAVEKPKDVSERQATGGARRGLLGTVRVGSRSAEPPVAPVPPKAAAPAKPTKAEPAEPTGPLTLPAVRPDRRKLLLGGGVLVAVLALIAVVAFAIQGSGDHTAGTAGSALPAPPTGSAPAASTSPAGQSPAQSPAAGSAAQPPAAQSPTPAAPTTAAPTTAAPSAPAIPAGFTEYKDSQGFSVAIPAGFNIADSTNTHRQFKNADGSSLWIEWKTPPGASALKDWQDSASTATFPGYHQINVAAVPGWRWTNAADWEFTYTGSSSGTTRHALDRGFVTGKYGYAIYWTFADAEWASPASVQDRQVSFDTFQPAP